MNNDLISRDYVEKIIESGVVDLQDGTEEWRSFVNETCYDILNKVHNAPTIDSLDLDVHIGGRCCGKRQGLLDELRPKGEWISVEEKDRRESEQKGVTIKTLSYRKLYNCSLCGCDFNSSFKFCPNCGADMRGEEE